MIECCCKEVADTQDRIKEIRRRFNLTQQELADRICVKRGAIANYEIGRNEPSDSVVSLICREFHVNEQWLRTGEGSMIESMDVDNEIAEFSAKVLRDRSDSFRKRFISALSVLDPEDWAVLEKIADELAKRRTDP